MADAPGQFRNLIAWRKSYALSLLVYQSTKAFPAEEKYGLTQQIRRSAVSVPSNIAEGWGRGSRVDYVRFLCIARGSLYELDTQLNLARDLDILKSAEDLFELLNETQRVLNGLIRSLQSE